ncbi:adenylate-forming reductase 06235-like [Glycine soja]|uniref:Adenylate-forming reductase 06235 n=1 Tax=Glycine soja TaxID=3848 RepID=A0A445IBK6_GLYSO|nr:adenylate-forming reductase 06235-like [Glycine soja]RZB83441.1 Adenylate-forming reductase 06235 [Glycine soja]
MEERENKEIKIARFSSCRGVAFEINPNRSNPFAIGSPPKQERIGTWLWLPWTRNSSFKVLPQPHTISPTRSRASSHFCDIDIDASDFEVEFIAEVQDIEKPDKANVVKVQKLLPKSDPPRRSRLSIILLDQGFTCYKGLFLVCMALNVVALALSAAGCFPYAKTRAALFSIGNILALTLCRSEAALRVIFWLTVQTLGRPCVSLRIKTATTSFLQSVGGIHSGCGVSSIAWLAYSLVLTLKNKDKTSPEIIGVAFTILSLILLSSFAAFPLIRHLHHNVFERIHRFAGWMALILLWLFILLSISYEPYSHTYDLTMSKVVKKQECWFTLAITILIIIPWLSVRKVQVNVSSASSHASIIKFEGGVEAGLLGRISPSPLSEWHAFGIISDGKKEHMMLAGAVGDFTKSLVSTPPKHLWVRTMHFAGLPYLVNLYQRVLLVATGSGICVFLSFLLQPSKADVCLIWVAKDIELNFGREIIEMMNKYSKEKVIVHDTAISGRPNVAEVSVNAAIKWNVEVVIVTSNPEGSRDVLRACKRANIPAFGPIWDS